MPQRGVQHVLSSFDQEDELNHTKEIPVWMFGAKLRQKFGPIPEGGDPSLLPFTSNSTGRMADASCTPWARDQLISANQNRVNF